MRKFPLPAVKRGRPRKTSPPGDTRKKAAVRTKREQAAMTATAAPAAEAAGPMGFKSAHLEYATLALQRHGHARCGPPTTWTVLPNDGPNHLGL